MARPSYLARRGDGRYFLQIRLGKQAAKLFGLPLLRVSLRTGDFTEARRRLVNNLGWVQELIEAPDLESLGVVIEARLATYVGRDVPTDERLLAERCAFEHEVRRYLTRAQERGYAYQMQFPKIPSLWVDLVNQNKAAESGVARLAVRRSYEAGRVEATEAARAGWTAPAAPTQAQPFDPIAMIDRLVQDAVAQRLPQIPAQQAARSSLPPNSRRCPARTRLLNTPPASCRRCWRISSSRWTASASTPQRAVEKQRQWSSSLSTFLAIPGWTSWPKPSV